MRFLSYTYDHILYDSITMIILQSLASSCEITRPVKYSFLLVLAESDLSNRKARLSDGSIKGEYDIVNFSDRLWFFWGFFLPSDDLSFLPLLLLFP